MLATNMILEKFQVTLIKNINKYYWLNPKQKAFFKSIFAYFKYRHLEVFFWKGVPQNFAKFTGKHLYWNFFSVSIKLLTPLTGFQNNSLEAWNFHQCILVGVLSSRAESIIWRCAVSCSKYFRAPWKHLWWSFSQVESFMFENHVKVEPFTYIFMEIYQNSYIE